MSVVKDIKIYIDNFRMPSCCNKCPFVKYSDGNFMVDCLATESVFIWNDTPKKTRAKNCPLKFE